MYYTIKVKPSDGATRYVRNFADKVVYTYNEDWALKTAFLETASEYLSDVIELRRLAGEPEEEVLICAVTTKVVIVENDGLTELSKRITECPGYRRVTGLISSCKKELA